MMRRISVSCLVALCLVGLLSLPVFAAELEDVENSIQNAFEKYDSLRANMEVEGSVPMQDMKLTLMGNGTLSYLKSENGGKYRQEVTLRAPEPVSLEIEMAVISDGEETVIINNMMGRQNVMRQNPNFSRGTVPPGGKDLLEVLERETDVALLDDAETDGHAVYVLEVRPNEGSDEHFSRARLHIDKELGVMRLISMYPEGSNESIGTVRFSDFELNPTLDPSIFEYE